MCMHLNALVSMLAGVYVIILARSDLVFGSCDIVSERSWGVVLIEWQTLNGGYSTKIEINSKPLKVWLNVLR